MRVEKWRVGENGTAEITKIGPLPKSKSKTSLRINTDDTDLKNTAEGAGAHTGFDDGKRRIEPYQKGDPGRDA
ncbi:MAG: hypothetical protein LAO78_03215 [Acidobacteriia bacterium]|nr:hypothetical protein [Terriglobia bacterium]